MYVRLVNVTRGSRTYRYAQLVESFRRPDGKPTNRVIANLGALDDVAVANLKEALKASREGKALPALGDALGAVPRPSVTASLRYLDLAVLLQLWRTLGFHDLITAALPESHRSSGASDIIAALALQRCVAPASKLAAERWYPTTALPELQGIAPSKFNNSRLHRVLAALEEGEPAIQAGLSSTVQSWEGAFSALFIDATDTWFVGEGPPLAQKGRDKEGVYRRRIGLVMLCDQRGFPLRWQTLAGHYHDGTALMDMAREAAALPWARGIPVVIDRAVGHASATETLHASGLRYVTALPDPELESSGVPIPWELLESLRSETSVEVIGRTLSSGGFSTRGRGRWVCDLGTFDKAHSAEAGRVSVAAAAMDILDCIEATGSDKAAVEQAGVTTRHVRRHKPLRTLIPAVRARLRTADACRLALSDLLQIALAQPDEQGSVLATLLIERVGKRNMAHNRSRATYRARAVLSVSPERMLSDRMADEERVAKVEALVADVNRRLSHPSNRRTDASALAEVQEGVRRHSMGSVFRTSITGTGWERRISLEKDEIAWARRRRGDGINVIISNPEVAGTAEEMVNLYFSKDQIERDFRIIKSVVELRPIHHRTDTKVRAHVTICILALLVLRALEAQLQQGTSATSALESLEPVRLNRISQGEATFYSATRPEGAASSLLKQLRMLHLVDDAQVAADITPR